MRILLVTPFLPYPGVPHAGGKLVYLLLRTLAGKHTVTLVSRHYPGEEIHIPFLRTMVSGVETVYSKGPVNKGNLWSVVITLFSYIRLARKASEVVRRERFDACQVEFTETGVIWNPPVDIPTVLTCHDIIAKPAIRRYDSSRGILRPILWAWKRMIVLAEKSAVSKFNRVVTLSDEDLTWANRLYPGVSCTVLRYPGGIEFTGLPRQEVPGRLLFIGAMNRPSNIEAVRYFVRSVWPIVREKFRESEFWVVGGGLPEQVRSEISSDPRVRVVGKVDDLEGYYRSASVFVAPILRGGGVIVKILDAMAAEVPVVTTSYGNEGILAMEGSEILVADDPASFADRVISLLGNTSLRISVGSAGKRLMKERFSFESFEKTAEQLYEGLGPGPWIPSIR